MAVQDRQSRPPARVQARGHTADGEGRAVYHRRHTPVGHRARRTTGELNWAHSLREGRRAAVSPRQLSGRGVSYWTDGKGDERVLYVTTGYRLVALDAKTGAMIQSFATKACST